MTGTFIPEHEVYGLLSSVGIRTPRHIFVGDDNGLSKAPFTAGDAVVVKGIARDLWHKSDVGALTFCDFGEEVAALHRQMREDVGRTHDWLGTLIAERVEARRSREAPSEIFVSLQGDQCCGAIISFGFGGVLTEDWARELKQSLLLWPASVYSPQEAFAELREHWLGKILLGKARSGKARTDEKTLLRFLENLWKLDDLMQQERIALLEMNPLVIDMSGEIVALDGVGQRVDAVQTDTCPVPLQDDSLLNPQRIALAGVSSKAGSVGGLILKNLRKSALSDKNLVVIKPGADEIDGIRCVPDIAALLDDPVNILIVALPAKRCVPMIEQLCEQGGGADVVYIVAGGIGDGADRAGYGERLSSLSGAPRSSARTVWVCCCRRWSSTACSFRKAS